MLRLYPEYQQEFSNDIQHDLTFNMREGYEAEAEESDMNVPSLVALPSISEDDENQSEHAGVAAADHASSGSPRTAALLRSPLLLKSPRRKFLQRESSLTTLRERVERQRSVTVKSDEYNNNNSAEADSKSLDGLSHMEMVDGHGSGSYPDVNNAVGQATTVLQVVPQFDRLDSLHQDVAALSIEVRNAIQALQEVTYSRLASNVQLCGFPPARSIPNLGMNCGGVGISHESDLVRSSSHPPEMWGREMGIFAMHPDNPFQQDIHAAAAAAAEESNNLFATLVNPNPNPIVVCESVATQTEDPPEKATNRLVTKSQGNDLLRLVEETIVSNPEILLHILRKNESFAQCAQVRRLAREVMQGSTRTSPEEPHPNGSKIGSSSSSSRPRQANKSNCSSNNSNTNVIPEGSSATSIINNSVQYYEEAEQKLLSSVKSKLRRKLSSEKVRRRNNYNDSSARLNGLPPAHRFSAGDADGAEPEGVRANHSTRSLKDN